eukprot:GHVS01063294.1.p1 GENE.GHVS01063294.1~~GHVS01063294.1.p1  ORF type:complete len:145 (+),score=0.89 GHVS01063294.1:234-668(+)
MKPFISEIWCNVKKGSSALLGATVGQSFNQDRHGPHGLSPTFGNDQVSIEDKIRFSFFLLSQAYSMRQSQIMRATWISMSRPLVLGALLLPTPVVLAMAVICQSYSLVASLSTRETEKKEPSPSADSGAKRRRWTSVGLWRCEL